MKSSLVCLKVSVKKSPIHGYGVFAEQDIAANTIIEECHTLVSESDVPCFDRYYFKAEEKRAIALGNGSIYNHSNQANAYCEWDNEFQLVTITSEKDIKKGEEICIYYGDHYFSYRGIKVKADSWRVKWRRIWPLVSTVMRFGAIAAGLYYFLYVIL